MFFARQMIGRHLRAQFFKGVEFAEVLGKFVVEFRNLLGLDGVNRARELCILAREMLREICRDIRREISRMCSEICRDNCRKI